MLCEFLRFLRSQLQPQPRENFCKVSSTVMAYRKYSSELTFEKFAAKKFLCSGGAIGVIAAATLYIF